MSTEAILTDSNQKPITRLHMKETAANKIIKKYILLTSGASLVPYDFVDVITSTIAQTMMIRELCQLYEVSYSNKMANIAFWSVTGSLVSKAITGVLDAVISKSQTEQQFDLTGAAIAGIYTATIGEFYKLHLQNGGTLDDIKLADFGDFFVDEIKSGDLSLATFTNPSALMTHLKI